MDAPYYNGGPLDDDPDGEAYARTQDADRDPGCPLCEARDGEPHAATCPMFAPACACGRPARRMVRGEWFCTKCAPQGRVQEPAA